MILKAGTIHNRWSLFFCNISFLIIYMLFFLPVQGIAQATVFHISHDDYKPFHWYDEEEQITKGIFVDICEEILRKRLGYDVVYHQYPWTRAQNMVETGREDAYISTPTPERLKYIVAGQVSLALMKKVIFTNKDNPQFEKINKIKTIEELRPYRILEYFGCGWSALRLVQEHQLSVEYATVIDQVLEKLALGRGDIVIEDPRIIHYNLKLLGLTGKVVETAGVLEETEFKLCISRKSPFVALLPEIDRLLIEIEKDGTLQKIFDKWK